MTDTLQTPVVFVHGLWLHGSSWQPWVDRFKEAGYDAMAPGWPGDAETVEATRANAEAVANHGVDEITDHYAKVDVDNEDRGPLLLTMGGMDHTVPEAITKATLKQYRKSLAVTDIKEFDDRGHSLTIDHGWREVADSILEWIKGKGF